MSKFEEGKHPRESDGKFGSGSGKKKASLKDFKKAIKESDPSTVSERAMKKEFSDRKKTQKKLKERFLKEAKNSDLFHEEKMKKGINRYGS